MNNRVQLYERCELFHRKYQVKASLSNGKYYTHVIIGVVSLLIASALGRTITDNAIFYIVGALVVISSFSFICARQINQHRQNILDTLPLVRGLISDVRLLDDYEHQQVCNSVLRSMLSDADELKKRGYVHVELVCEIMNTAIEMENHSHRQICDILRSSYSERLIMFEIFLK